MIKAKIKIKSHWNIPPKEGYNIGDEFDAILHPCTPPSNDECYAVLHNGDTIPAGNFDILGSSAKKVKNVFRKEFSQGYACALTAIISSHGISTPVIESWTACFGYSQTVASLKRLGIDEHDIAIIKPHLKEINKKR